MIEDPSLFTSHGNGYLSPEELVDALNEGIVQSIKSCGKSLPSSAITNPSSSPVQCEWTEYATVSSSSNEEGEGVGKSFTSSSPLINDLKQFFPSYLDGSEYGTDGRPLIYAACLGLLLSCGEDNDSNNPGEKTPLSTFLSIASYLLKEVGANPNQPTETPGACHRPPLHLVARSCHPAAVRMLMEGGAADSRDDEGWSALMACCMSDIPSADDGGPSDEDRVETLKLLLTEIDDVDYVNARNWCGYNALHYACEGLNASLIQCLLETGRVDATLRTIWGQSCVCLIQSERERNPEEAVKCEALIIEYLEKTGQITDFGSFLEEERKVIALMSLADDVLIPASRKPECTADESSRFRINAANDQDVRIVTALMKYFGIDPALVFEKNDDNISTVNGNIYEELQNRVTDLIPNALRKVYRNQPTEFEREIILGTNYNIRKEAEVFVEGLRHIDTSRVMDLAFRMHRERGHVAERMAMMTDLLVGPLQRTFSYAIPDDETVKEIVSHAPRIVEMGAGTGYWSAMLNRNGADVIAFDAHPGTEQKNVYVGKQMYYPVQEGIDTTVFVESKPDIVDRALLLVWPNNPDDLDNPHVRLEGESMLPPIWDIDCLQRYYDLGGQTVIYVGEREEKIPLVSDATGPDCGFCGSRKFQQFLWDNFDLKSVIECPKWWMKEDDVTVWKRK
uniref:Uncharacterized protein n=1 Tax=Skeletonema marinoi TaxID=267567 RepID=A0A7S2PCF1_9STRA|mmetsp:Transcript_17813/g.30120  ORF Transcript_17813/g.30120 Transcript_17813/m.30120 type:complete len:680 (+) Transcript_17813:59-2098(+)